MPLDLYRRHLKNCKFREKGTAWTRCNCPVWVDGQHPVTGKRLRRSVGSRDWGRAMRLLERWEAEQREDSEIKDAGGPTLKTAAAAFLADCERRKLTEASLRGYRKSLDHFTGIVGPAVSVAELDVSGVRKFSAERATQAGRRGPLTSPQTLRKELEHARAFLEFCVENGWLPTNPARKVRAPRDDSSPTMPFSPDEIRKLLAACDKIDNPNWREIPRARVRARALVLLLLYSGLRLGDAVSLDRARIDSDGRLLLRMEKTREPLYVKLPAEAIEALRALPGESRWFFWSGTAKLSTATGSARRTVDCICRIAGIEGHPHRFRDTFAVELLKSGADLRTVQKLLGHTSVRTTEKHYAPWVSAFQKQLDDATAKLKFG